VSSSSFSGKELRLPAYGASSGWRVSTPARLFLPACGILSWFVPAGLADEVVALARAEAAAEAAAVSGPELPLTRLRLLPARLGVYFVLGLCLSSGLPYRRVLGGLCGLRAGEEAASTALTALRRRLGPRPFELLFARVASALAPPGQETWSHAFGLLLTAWDGTTLKIAASAGNAGWAGGTGQGGHYPRARLVALACCGTRGLLGAAVGPFSTGERALALTLTGRLHAGMLLLADRGFYSWGLWHAAAGTGAHLLWRVPACLHLPVVRALPDGSWLTRVSDPRAKDNRYRKNGKRRRAGKPPDTSPLPAVTVRVIEFTVTVTRDDGTTRTGRYRMITTLLDCRQAPAAGLAAAYARRWAVETCFAELKTHLRGPGRILRSRAPDLALQEIWAYLAAYQAIRAVIAHAAAGTAASPARLSFTAALHALRGTIRRDPAAALAETTTAALASPVPDRPGRVWVRGLREPGAAYPAAAQPKDPLAHHATCTITIPPPATPTPTAASQPKQPHNQENPAP
jgi:Transposase DDE domain/Insertion element 4 transposase N-terminal